MTSRGFVLILTVFVIGVGLYLLALDNAQETTSMQRMDSSAHGATDSNENEPLTAAQDDPDGAVALRGDARPREDDSRDRHPTLRVFGLVTDEGKDPIEGAAVEIQHGDAVWGRATTATDGSYEAECVIPASWDRRTTTQAFAKTGDGRVGLVTLYFPRSSRPEARAPKGNVKAWDIVVATPQGIHVQVTSECDGGIPATLHLLYASLGRYTLRRELQTDERGHRSLDDVPQGAWLIVASAPGCGQDIVEINVPRADTAPIQLVVPVARSVAVRVQEAGSERPIAGADVSVGLVRRTRGRLHEVPLVSSPDQWVTDERGQSVITGLARDDHLRVRAEAEGYPVRFGAFRPHGGPGVAEVRPRETECVITLPLPRTVRWPIEDKGQGVPAEGSSIVLKPFANSGHTNIPTNGIVEGGQIVVEGWGPGYASAMAYAAGVGAARLHAKPDEEVGFPAVFYPLRKIELFAKEADGRPAVGVWLSARGPGNNSVQEPAETNTQGYAVLEDLYFMPGWRVNCFVSRNKQEYARTPLGAVDLSKGNGSFDFQFPRERKLRVTITIDGVPPPEGFRRDVRWGTSNVSLAPDARGVCEVAFTPIRASGTVSLPFRWREYRIEKPITVDLEQPDPIPVSIALQRTYKALVEVVLPNDGRHHVYYEAWDLDKKAWRSSRVAHMRTGHERVDANGIVTFTGLRPGRYRAVDLSSKIASESFEVSPSQPVANAVLDLSLAGWAKGRVVPPEGVPLAGFSVGVDGARPSPQGALVMPGYRRGVAGRPVDAKNGSFWFRCVSGQSKKIRLFHASCLPHPTKGYATVDGPVEGLELHAIRGATATIILNPKPNIRMNPGKARHLNAILYSGELNTEHAVPVHVTLNGAHDTLTLGKYKPGTYTLWVDVPNKAPLVMRNVTLTDKSIDLGHVATTPGSRFRLTVKVKEGQSPPRMSLFVTAENKPTYSRRTDGAGTLVVEGIGKGRFRVDGNSYGGSAARINEVIEFDGENDVEREIDLR